MIRAVSFEVLGIWAFVWAIVNIVLQLSSDYLPVWMVPSGWASIIDPLVFVLCVRYLGTVLLIPDRLIRRDMENVRW